MITRTLHITVIALITLSLCACDRVENNLDTLGNNIGHGYDKTRYKMSDYTYAREKESPLATSPYQAPQSSYCYRMLSDIVCYDQPVERMRNQLVGQQAGAGGYSTYAESNVEASAPVANVNTSSISGHRTYFDEVAPNDGHAETNSGTVPPLDSVSVGSAPQVSGSSDSGSPRNLMSGY